MRKNFSYTCTVIKETRVVFHTYSGNLITSIQSVYYIAYVNEKLKAF